MHRSTATTESWNRFPVPLPNPMASRPPPDPTPLMRLARICSVAARLLPFVAGGQEATSPENEEPQSDMRRAILSAYTYAPPSATPAPLPSSPRSDATRSPVSAEGAREVVKMGPYVVREAGLSNSKYLAMAQEPTVT